MLKLQNLDLFQFSLQIPYTQALNSLPGLMLEFGSAFIKIETIWTKIQIVTGGWVLIISLGISTNNRYSL